MRTLFGGSTLLRMTSGFARTGGQFMRSTGQLQLNESQTMKNLIRSIDRSPLRCGLFTLTIALTWFALSPPIKAQCPSNCSNDSNTAVGNNALPAPTGFNNTAVGSSALTPDTIGGPASATSRWRPHPRTAGTNTNAA